LVESRAKGSDDVTAAALSSPLPELTGVCDVSGAPSALFAAPGGRHSATALLLSCNAHAATAASEWESRVAGALPSVLCKTLFVYEAIALKLIKGTMLKLAAKSRANAPAESTACYFGSVKPLLEAAKLENKLDVSVLLIDLQGRIRWSTTGRFSAEEYGKLIAASAQLDQERN
jgi:hypothetical protein